MLDNLLNLKEIKLANAKGNMELESVSGRDIAIIGMAGMFGEAENLEQFWRKIREGADLIRAFPEQRKAHNEPYFRILERTGLNSGNAFRYGIGAFLESIDRFDCSFFNLSPKEAAVMDPNQRIFLETMWAAIEEAGYGGKKLTGTKTGVYLGFSSDFGEEYKRYVQVVAPGLAGFSVSGNIKSVLASRISYLLDLKGPSMVVDTACSSALVAVHLACTGLRLGECDMAIAGGIKLNLVPVTGNGQDNIGINSSDGRTRTFDDHSDGTGIGEGAGAVLLKPLNKAIIDKDHVYAVIKGSAVNQDGTSVSLTAPNSAAQEDVLLRAWKDAGIDPETISLIEAHGTGTKLGDPVEVSAIKNAFRRYTDKRQFCAVSSVKTNIGHLDNAAGISGLLKTVLALVHKELPPSLHFEKPNCKINFEDSPVYVNDRLRQWDSGQSPRRCGISSFGLSGTNCHIVLEEAPAGSRQKDDAGCFKPHLFTLSAKTEAVLQTLVSLYRAAIRDLPEEELADICYTVNTGRGSYAYRLAVLCSSLGELKAKMEILDREGLCPDEASGIYYGRHTIIPAGKTGLAEGEISETGLLNNNRQAALILEAFKTGNKEDYRDELITLCKLYIAGAEFSREALYAKQSRNKLVLPVYPFERRSCWVQPDPFPAGSRGTNHPLLGHLLAATMDINVYSAHFSVDTHWVLREHKVLDAYVVPGTAYVEMAYKAGMLYYKDHRIEINRLVFINPLIVREGETREVHCILKTMDTCLEFSVVSKEPDSSWVKHAEGKIYPSTSSLNGTIDRTSIMTRCREIVLDLAGGKAGSAIETGPRWKNIKKIYAGDEELLSYHELPPDYLDDLDQYALHPAMLDCAVNAANISAGEGIYLPYSYGRLKISGPAPARFYGCIKKRNKARTNTETAVFDLWLLDEKGAVFAAAEDYTIKKLHQSGAAHLRRPAAENAFYELKWVPASGSSPAAGYGSGAVLILMDNTGTGSQLADVLCAKGVAVIEAAKGREYACTGSRKYTISPCAEHYTRLLEAIKPANITGIIHLMTLGESTGEDNPDSAANSDEWGVMSLYRLTRALVAGKYNQPVDLVLVADYANAVTKTEKHLHPGNAALFGLGKVVGQEYPHLRCRCIDIDEHTDTAVLLREIEHNNSTYAVSYRAGVRYVEEFKPADIPAGITSGFEWKKTGIYLITGGLGGIGLEAARYFTEKHKVNLCLISRTALPGREQWDTFLKTTDAAGAGIRRALAAIRYMETRGANVVVRSADVADWESIQRIYTEIRQVYGRVNGIIHAAGIPGNGFIINRAETGFREVLAAKMQGTRNLHKLAIKDNPDCFVMFSSVTALTGAPGQGDYTAANAFLDSFAAYRRKLGMKALTINWPAWKEVGMAVDYRALDKEGLFKPVDTLKALAALETLLDAEVDRVFAGELDLKLLAAAGNALPIRVSAQLIAALQKHKQQEKPARTTARVHSAKAVKLAGRGKDQYSITEQTVGKVWGELLGMEEISIYDKFHNLGGDSILAARLLKEIDLVFPGAMDISDIYTYTTINDMAEYINSRLVKEDKKAEIKMETDIDSILSGLAKGEISLSDADKLIS